MDGGEKSRQVGELDLIVEQLLVSGSLSAQPPLDAEVCCDTTQSHRAAERAEGDVVPDPIAAAQFDAVVGPACEVHQRHGLEGGRRNRIREQECATMPASANRLVSKPSSAGSR